MLSTSWKDKISYAISLPLASIKKVCLCEQFSSAKYLDQLCQNKKECKHESLPVVDGSNA